MKTKRIIYVLLSIIILLVILNIIINNYYFIFLSSNHFEAERKLNNTLFDRRSPVYPNSALSGITVRNCTTSNRVDCLKNIELFRMPNYINMVTETKSRLQHQSDSYSRNITEASDDGKKSYFLHTPMGGVVQDKYNSDVFRDHGSLVRMEVATPKGFLEVVRENPRNVIQKNGDSFYLSDSSFSPDSLQRRLTDYFSNNSEIVKFVRFQNDLKEYRGKYCTKVIKNSHRHTHAYKNIILDKDHRLLFCPIYKSASTTWLVNLLRLNGVSNSPIKDKVQDLVTAILLRINNALAAPIVKHFTSFLIVRHPLNRLVSAYRDKFENASKFYYYERYGEKMVRIYRNIPKNISSSWLEITQMLNEVRKFLKNPKSTTISSENPYANPIGPTFSEFVAYISQRGQENDDHWRPYYMQCSLCDVEYQFVLRFESLAYDSKKLLEYLNISEVLDTGWENPTLKGKTDDKTVCGYLSQISTNLFLGVLKKYYYDFYLFQYRPDHFLKCLPDFKTKNFDFISNVDDIR